MSIDSPNPLRIKPKKRARAYADFAGNWIEQHEMLLRARKISIVFGAAAALQLLIVVFAPEGSLTRAGIYVLMIVASLLLVAIGVCVVMALEYRRHAFIDFERLVRADPTIDRGSASAVRYGREVIARLKAVALSAAETPQKSKD